MTVYCKEADIGILYDILGRHEYLCLFSLNDNRTVRIPDKIVNWDKKILIDVSHIRGDIGLEDLETYLKMREL